VLDAVGAASTAANDPTPATAAVPSAKRGGPEREAPG
jgi:hypothetical protein